VAVATRFWVAGHGLASLVVTQVLPADVVPEHAAELAVGVFVAAGDRPETCRTSVLDAWSRPSSRTGGGSGERG
jgi:hypothetical protein